MYITVTTTTVFSEDEQLVNSTQIIKVHNDEERCRRYSDVYNKRLMRHNDALANLNELEREFGFTVPKRIVEAYKEYYGLYD